MLTSKKIVTCLCIVTVVGVMAQITWHFRRIDYKIKLRWSKAHPDESWPHIRTGLIWSLSYLGATLPTGSLDKATDWIDDRHFILDLKQLGFSENALENLHPLLTTLKDSEEYEKMGGIDLGRFFMYTLHSSWHYYAITGVEQRLENFHQRHRLQNPVHYLLSSSGVAKEQRIISFNIPQKWEDIAFVGKEAEGKTIHLNVPPEAFETIDLMPNGQLRFALYGKNGTLESHADTSLTEAGKPGKCQWCHEKHLQPIFYPTEDLPQSIKKEEFLEYVSQAQSLIDQYRTTLQTDITYQNPQDHTYAELLYITFLEPSLERVANEWGMSAEEVAAKLASFPTHGYREFPHLGQQLYHRKWIDSLAPYAVVKIPESAREKSTYEPDVTGLKAEK